MIRKRSMAVFLTLALAGAIAGCSDDDSAGASPRTETAEAGAGDTGAGGADAGNDSATGDTDAGDTDAGDTDAGDTDAGDTDASDTDASDTDAGDTDAGDTDASDTDAGDTDAGDTDAGDTDASDTDASDTDAGDTDAGDTDASDTDAGDTNTSKLIIAASGGTISLGGATLVIPAGALAADTTITIERLSAAGLPDTAKVTGSVYDFGPDGTTFSTAATLTLTGSSLPAGAAVAFLNGSNAWEALADSTLSGNAVTGKTSHFTKFAIVAFEDNQPVNTCPATFDACGGDLTGSWTLVDSAEDCVYDPEISEMTGSIPCAEEAGIHMAGSITFTATNYESSVATNMSLTFGKACLGDACPSEYEDTGDKCVSTGGDDSGGDYGTYTTEGGTFTTVSTKPEEDGGGADEETYSVGEYCVTGSGNDAKAAFRVREYADAAHTQLLTEFVYHATKQ